MQMTTGVAYELSNTYDKGSGTNPVAWKLLEMADIELGSKVGVGEADALRVGIGTVYLAVPLLAEVTWLHDLNASWTTDLGLGTRGLCAGIGHHFRLGDWAIGHVSLTGTVSGFSEYRGCRQWCGCRSPGSSGSRCSPCSDAATDSYSPYIRGPSYAPADLTSSPRVPKVLDRGNARLVL